jgi:phosphatidylethanolamine-binding protein (PEBP) family uncharacterized protein
MRRPLKAISSTASIFGAVLALALTVAGCGSSTKTATRIPLASSAIEGRTLPAHFTCDGANIAPPIKWGGVPSGTKEVVLFAIGKNPSSHGSSTIEWALAGVSPELGELAAGKVPSGAFLEEASDGKRHYSICPPKGQTRLYAFAIYAVPQKIIVTRSVNGVTLYHNLAEGKPEFRATAAGALTASYTRK